MPRTGFAMVSILSNPQLARPLAIASPASLHQEGLAFGTFSFCLAVSLSFIDIQIFGRKTFLVAPANIPQATI
jgi:hypothetical protein